MKLKSLKQVTTSMRLRMVNRIAVYDTAWELLFSGYLLDIPTALLDSKVIDIRQAMTDGRPMVKIG
jgi:hypothetical protein